MSASTDISASNDDARAKGSAALPFWATPAGVHAIVALYFFAYFLIAVTLHSTLGVDNAIENYNAQALAISYSPRNPPLYDWILFFIQKLTGPGPMGFAILNYGSLFACAATLYRVARRVIFDPKLQALSIYAYSLLWDIGHESHRILTHSNLMIVAVAASVLVFLQLAEKRRLSRYLWLGFWIAFGLLAKLGFAAFVAALLLSAFWLPAYRSVLLDRRIFATIIFALLPVAVFLTAELFLDHSIIGETESVLSKGAGSGLLPRVTSLSRSLFGYVVPLLPIAAAVFYRQPAEHQEETAERRDARLLFAAMLLIGVVFALIWALVIGSTQLRSRYFHALLLIFPVALFAFLDRRMWPSRPLNIFLGASLLVTAGIMVEQMLPRLAPSEFLCGQCRLSIPYDLLGREIEARFGATPTLVALDSAYAGRLRAAVPDARAVTLSGAAWRPPFREAKPCVLVWLDQGAAFATVTAAAGVSGSSVEAVEIPWFQPLSREQRTSRFNLAQLPESSDLCR